MPMRLYNASTKHVNDNLWVWIGISLAAMLALSVFDRQMPVGQGLGNWVALAGSVLGILLMLKSEAEMPKPEMVDPSTL